MCTFFKEYSSKKDFDTEYVHLQNKILVQNACISKIKEMHLQNKIRLVSAENSNVRGGGEVVSLSVMEGPGHCHTNNTCSQKLDTCHQMSILIPDKPGASCVGFSSYDYTTAAKSFSFSSS